jgi:agmatine deiminase
MTRQPANPTPAELGYSMPAEWAPHEATWLGWPHNASDWPGKIEAIHWVYGEIARRIAPGEKLYIFAHSPAIERKAKQVLRSVGVPLARVKFFRIRTNRGWTRDSGPITLVRSSRPLEIERDCHPESRFNRDEGSAFARKRADSSSAKKASGLGMTTDERPRPERAVVKFHFNGWARYSDWRLDARTAEFAARKLRLPVLRAAWKGRPFVLEGGAIDVNGRGTLLTTEECLLDQKRQARNPGLSRKEVEAALREFLGVKNILWLGRGIAGDDTHGHVDDLCRFVNERTVVLCREGNPRDANYRALEENRERLRSARLADGSKLQVVDLPMPSPLIFQGQRLPASYANFYFANSAVLVPTFNDYSDARAIGILSEVVRDRPVVGIHAADLVWGLGTLHCMTQQLPNGKP